MPYSDLLEEEGIEANFLCVLKPSRRQSSWALFSGAVYETDWQFGYAINVKVDGVAYAKAADENLNQEEWFYSNDDKKLYIRLTSNDNPNNVGFITVTYEMAVSTFDAHFQRIPDSAESADNVVIYWDPVIAAPPNIKSTTKDITFGFMPTRSTTIRLTNAEHFIEQHLYDGSFNQKDIDIYHWLDEELDFDNIKLVYRGKLSKPVYNDSTVSFSILDSVDEFDKEFRSDSVSGQDSAFFNTTDFPDLDPNFSARPIPYVYGVVDGFVPVNVDYKEEEPTTSDNRAWATRADGNNNHEVTGTVAAGSSTTVINLVSAVGLKAKDSVWFDKAVDEYRRIISVDYGANTITVAALVSGIPVASDTVKRGTIGYVDIRQNEVLYQAQYNRDWTESVNANGTLLINLSTSIEANLSIPETLNASEDISCSVYGKKNDVTLGGSPFGAEDAKIGNLTALPVIMFDILVNFLGLSESVINTASFTSLLVDTDEAIGIQIPSDHNGDFPKFKQLLIDMLKTGFVKLYQNFDIEWEVQQTQPISTTSKEFDSDEILDKTIKYEFNYDDIDSDFIVEYAFNEKDQKGSRVTSSSDIAKFLHGVTTSRTEKSLHIFEEDAQLLADRLKFTYGDQQGNLTINLKNRVFDETIDSDLKINRVKLPGFSFDESIERERDFSIIDIDKASRC